MKRMKIVWCGFLTLLIAGQVSAQNVDVKIDPKMDIDVKDFAKNVALEIMNDIEFDMVSEFELDFDVDEKDKNKYQQTFQEIEIPLSKPGERGTLDVSTRNGKITVTGYDGPTVKIKIIKYEKKVEKTSTKNGMRLVSSGGFNFEAKEYDNLVKVENGGWNDRLDFEIRVPKNFNVKADAYNNGYITLEALNGEIEAESYNGPITMTDISGSATASTYNGDVKIAFTSVTPDTPMAFNTYNGDVDLSVPAGTRFSTKMKTYREIYTDFENFTIKQTKPITEKGEKGGYNIKYENWVEGVLNGGGAEVMMETRNGDIYIRRK